MDSAHRSRRSFRLARALAFGASLMAVGCATIGFTPVASASVLSTVAGILPNCGVSNAVSPFVSWGDTRSYFLMPNGGFESGTTGWTAGAAKVVAGNESFYANSKTDSHSLSVPAGATVTSPTVCVAMGENTVRLFVKNPGVTGSTLHIQAYVQNPLTGLVLSTGFDLNSTAGATTWAPSVALWIPNLLGGVLGTQNVKLVLTTKGSGTWGVDDVFIDPFRTR
jgi:hypothetical protein